jgi:hypothetical protein
VRKCSVLVPTRPFTTIAVVSFALLFLDIDVACGFFKDISITPACDMAPKIVIVIPLAVGTMPLAGVPFRERP